MSNTYRDVSGIIRSMQKELLRRTHPSIFLSTDERKQIFSFVANNHGGKQIAYTKEYKNLKNQYLLNN